jgi:hypothetical protein
MLILFDQATPFPLRKFLRGHVIKTGYQQGWSNLLNGDLLRVAQEAGFDLLLTADKNLAYQQNPNKPQNCHRRSWQEPLEPN